MPVAMDSVGCNKKGLAMSWRDREQRKEEKKTGDI